MFAFDYAINKVNSSTAPSAAKGNAVANLSSDQSYILMPSGKNEVIVRFENLADRFDDVVGKTLNVDLKKFAVELY